MSDAVSATPIRVSTDQLKPILDLYDRGLYLQAYAMANAIGPLESWRGVSAQVVAGRLAATVGAPRLADWHFIRACRTDPAHPEAAWYYARYLLSRRGPLAAWEFMHSRPFHELAQGVLRAHWLSQHGAILGLLRDFESAETWLCRADEFGPEPWTRLERALVHSLEGRSKEAEAAARRALELRPLYRPGVQWLAQFLVQQDRDGEAIELLSEASRHLESGSVHAQLTTLLLAHDRLDDAQRAIDQFERLSPLLDKDQRAWLAARRCDLACKLGTPALAAQHAAAAKGKHYESIARRLQNHTEAGKRHVLVVPFVRPVAESSPPPMVASLARLWKVADLKSPRTQTASSERVWAEENGWFVKPFTVTWDAALSLIDRGIPFTLHAADVSTSPSQIVIGYDTACGTLIVRDQAESYLIDLAWDVVLEHNRTPGPAGLAMTPPAQSENLRSIELPDEKIRANFHQIEVAAAEHRLDEADKALREMAARNPTNDLTTHAQRLLAMKNGDSPAALELTEKLLKRPPGDLRLELDRADLLRALGRRSESIDAYRRLLGRKESAATGAVYLAKEQATDGRKHAETLRLLRKALRAIPAGSSGFGPVLQMFANVWWTQGRLESALQVFRFAACQQNADDQAIRSYVESAKALGKADQAITLFRRLAKRPSNHAPHPARSLALALDFLGRRREARNVLNEALKTAIRDGEILHYASALAAHFGEFEQAHGFLARAENLVAPAMHLRARARLAAAECDRDAERNLWKQVIQIEPAAEDAQAHYARCIAENEGRAAAARHLTSECERFARHHGILQLLYEWSLDDTPVEREGLLRRIVGSHPHVGWAHIELARVLSDQDRFDEAMRVFEDAESAGIVEPALFHAKASVYKRHGKFNDARFALREAIRLSVDHEPAVLDLLWLSDNLSDRRDTLSFIEKQLKLAPTTGASLLALHDAALHAAPPAELAAMLGRIQDARPDLWQTSAAVLRQLLHRERSVEAIEHAQRAVQRFPAAVSLWIGLAHAERQAGNHAKAVDALLRVLTLAPESGQALQMLIDALSHADRKDDARRALDDALANSPRAGQLHLLKADYLWRQNERDSAFETARQACKLDPDNDAAWSRLFEWCALLQRSNEAIELAKAEMAVRPGNARVWQRLAQAYQAQGRLPDAEKEQQRIGACAAAFREAIARRPSAIDLHDMLAEMLGVSRRYDEARLACNPPAFKKPPLELRGRLAWIKAHEGDLDGAKQEMRALVRDDRSGDWVWAWRNLFDWSAATTEYKDYIEAMSEALRRRPQSSRLLADRGAARLRADERAAGLDDLQAAFRKDPCDQAAGFVLFDELIADKDLARAEETLAVLQESLVGDDARARQVQLAARRGQQAPALANFRALCMNSATRPQAIEFCVRALDGAGWKKQAEAILCEAMKQPDWNLNLALLYAQLWNPNTANDLPDRLAALDRALVRQPDSFVLLDLKASLLVSATQFAQAWDVCQLPTLPIDKPRLEGRLAWVLYAAGKTEDAIAHMKELVKADPEYLWAWDQLAAWHAQQQKWVDVLTVAERLVQISPRDPVGFVHRGYAKQNLGDLQAAKADYAHAASLSPAYVRATWALFDVLTRGGEIIKAESALDKVRKFADIGEWSLRKISLLVNLNRKESFDEHFENLLKASTFAPWLIDNALGLLVQAGWWGDAEPVMRRNLGLGAHVCDPWIRTSVAMQQRRLEADIEHLGADKPERAHCLSAYALELAHAQDQPSLKRWIDRHAKALHADTACWGRIGLAFYVAQDWQGAADWMQDWRDHPQATPGQLIHLVKALRSIGHTDEARQVSLHALNAIAADGAVLFHKVWLMLDEALAGNLQSVRHYLETSDLGGFDPYHNMILGMVRAILVASAEGDRGFENARRLLADYAKFGQPTPRDPALGASYQAAVSKVAGLSASPTAWFWRAWRWFFPLLPALPKVEPMQR